MAITVPATAAAVKRKSARPCAAASNSEVDLAELLGGQDEVNADVGSDAAVNAARIATTTFLTSLIVQRTVKEEQSKRQILRVEKMMEILENAWA